MSDTDRNGLSGNENIREHEHNPDENKMDNE